MSELLTSGVGILGMIGILVIQYFLVKRPQRWLSFVLPTIYLALAIKNTVSAVLSGEVILGGVIGTAIIVFLAGNVMTILLLEIWLKRGKDKTEIVFSVFMTYIICSGLFMLVTYFAALNQVLADEELNPSPNVGNRIYVETEETYADYPVMLEDLGAEVQPYRYTNWSATSMPTYTNDKFIDSMVDDIENPTKILTLEYEVWSASDNKLDSREKTLKKRSDDEPVETTLDYGANASYWLGDNLLLRYDNCIVYFKDSSSRGLLDSETAAEFFQNEFEVPQE